jgi:hypothetical protein
VPRWSLERRRHHRARLHRDAPGANTGGAPVGRCSARIPDAGSPAGAGGLRSAPAQPPHTARSPWRSTRLSEAAALWATEQPLRLRVGLRNERDAITEGLPPDDQQQAPRRRVRSWLSQSGHAYPACRHGTRYGIWPVSGTPQVKAPPDPAFPQVRDHIGWRWRRDLNPRLACANKRFRGVLLRPLGHATAGKATGRRRCRRNRGGGRRTPPARTCSRPRGRPR